MTVADFIVDIQCRASAIERIARSENDATVELLAHDIYEKVEELNEALEHAGVTLKPLEHAQ